MKKSKFEGIILNFDMRHHDGMAVLESLHKQRVETPMIVVSHATPRERLEEAVRNGADEYERLFVRIYLGLCLVGMASLLTMCSA